MAREVVLNGRFVPYESATIPIEERGFQFAESVYEVVCSYRGKLFEMERHMQRFRNSAEAIGLDIAPRLKDLEAQSQELIRRSGLQEAMIYFQVSTGTAPRIHLRPEGLEPTILITAAQTPPVPERWRKEGISIITTPDDRWARCYIKTTMLLPNTMAKKRALDAGADDAIFVRDGFMTEGTSANAFAVFDGVLHTPPKSNYILHGVTREVILELASQLSIPAVEGPVPAEKLPSAQEMFLTGTLFQLAAITRLNGKPVGSGKPGPMVARLLDAFTKRALG